MSGNGLTLEALAERLEALEMENAGLRREVAALKSAGTPRAGGHESRLEGRVSRRALLTKTGAAAVAAVAAGTLINTREAEAVIVEDQIYADYIQAIAPGFDNAIVGSAKSDVRSGVYGVSSGFGAGVRGRNTNTTPGGAGVRGISDGTDSEGVYGSAEKGTGVRGYGVIGVRGESPTTGQAAVYAKHYSQGPGVVADGNGNQYAGVLGRNNTGAGVWGQSAQDGYEGVYGQHTGTSGYGVVGDGRGGSAGVLGRNGGGEGVRGEGNTYGVTGQANGTSIVSAGVRGTISVGTGNGVLGDGRGSGTAGVFGRNPAGYGGRFEGGKAHLLLIPKSTAGPPTAGGHAKGEIYMDSNAALWVCTVGGGPGTWRRISTTTA